MHWSQGPSWNHHHTLSPGAVLERVIWNINDILNLSCNYKYNNEYRTKKTRGNALYQCKPCINTETNGNTIDKCKKYKRRREVRWANLPRNHHYTRGLLTICWQCWWWLWECFFFKLITLTVVVLLEDENDVTTIICHWCCYKSDSPRLPMWATPLLIPLR